jgi:hypothetical protein
LQAFESGHSLVPAFSLLAHLLADGRPLFTLGPGDPLGLGDLRPQSRDLGPQLIDEQVAVHGFSLGCGH